MMMMMVVCSRSRVKPKGSPFHPIPLFISHDTLLAGALVLPLSLPGFFEWTGFGQWWEGKSPHRF
jgi:hypothetical protein